MAIMKRENYILLFIIILTILLGAIIVIPFKENLFVYGLLQKIIGAILAICILKLLK